MYNNVSLELPGIADVRYFQLFRQKLPPYQVLEIGVQKKVCLELISRSDHPLPPLLKYEFLIGSCVNQIAISESTRIGSGGTVMWILTHKVNTFKNSNNNSKISTTIKWTSSLVQQLQNRGCVSGPNGRFCDESVSLCTNDANLEYRAT